MIKDKYKIAYITGNLPNSASDLLKLKTKTGKILISEKGIKIVGSNENFEFKYNETVSCEYKRRQAFGFIILKSRKYTINIFIPRININNWFIITNFFATINVFEHLKKQFKKK